MARPARLRALRIVLMLLATLVAVPASMIIRGIFFPPKLDVPSIKAEATYQDPALLRRAWALPVAATYQRRLFFQPNGSVCGPTSVANVERSLGSESATVDSVLKGTGQCWTGICWMGLSLDQLAEVARHSTGRKVTVLRDLTLAQFREELTHVNDLNRRYIVNFQRAPLFAKGGGHHSPIAGYLANEDLVLVLDVNENFKPWLVKSERLFKAIDTGDTGQKRGLLRIDAGAPATSPAALAEPSASVVPPPSASAAAPPLDSTGTAPSAGATPFEVRPVLVVKHKNNGETATTSITEPGVLLGPKKTLFKAFDCVSKGAPHPDMFGACVAFHACEPETPPADGALFSFACSGPSAHLLLQREGQELTFKVADPAQLPAKHLTSRIPLPEGSIVNLQPLERRNLTAYVDL